MATFMSKAALKQTFPLTNLKVAQWGFGAILQPLLSSSPSLSQGIRSAMHAFQMHLSSRERAACIHLSLADCASRSVYRFDIMFIYLK